MKAECGILESDSPEEAEAKLERALPADDPDRVWIKVRLSPLVGAPAEAASQEASFTAWRRFLEALSAQGPTVLVVEDLHWADGALLAFLLRHPQCSALDRPTEADKRVRLSGQERMFPWTTPCRLVTLRT